jgi:hypothetical protein
MAEVSPYIQEIGSLSAIFKTEIKFGPATQEVGFIQVIIFVAILKKNTAFTFVKMASVLGGIPYSDELAMGTSTDFLTGFRKPIIEWDFAKGANQLIHTGKRTLCTLGAYSGTIEARDFVNSFW